MSRGIARLPLHVFGSFALLYAGLASSAAILRCRAAHRFSSRCGNRREDQVAVPRGCPPLYERPNLRSSQAKIDNGIQPLLSLENQPVVVLPI